MLTKTFNPIIAMLLILTLPAALTTAAPPSIDPPPHSLTNLLSPGTTIRVSVASDGTPGNGNSGHFACSISSDGRYVAFASWASNLVPGDTNSAVDIFVHDRVTGQTMRVSVDSSGVEANSDSVNSVAISADGRYVTFQSFATNLVGGDTNGVPDVFVHDRQTGQTTRVSIASDGSQGNNTSGDSELSISADGRYVAFYSQATNLVSSDTNGENDVFVHDRQTGQTERVSVASGGTQGNGASELGSMSADGRYVAFFSSASNLVPGDTNGKFDGFVYDRQTGQTSRVSVASDGAQGNNDSFADSISADGRYVVLSSLASNLVSGDTNGKRDVFVHDRQMGQTSRVSVASDGTQGNNDSYWPSISADGRYAAFVSDAGNLVSGDTNGKRDVFVHDRQIGQTSRVSVASDGTQGNGASAEWRSPSISGDGRYVAFQSSANNLVPDDTNGVEDVFVHDREGVSGPVPFLSSPCGENCRCTAYFDHCYPTYRSAPNCCSDDPFKKICLHWAAASKRDAAYLDGNWQLQCDQPGCNPHDLYSYYSGHDGYDYAGFDTILAAAAGRVAYVGCADSRDVYPSCNRSYGIIVDIDHENGYLTRYGHLRSTSVAGGSHVSAGQQIGLVGSTGRSTGPHLHFMVYEDININGQVDSGDKPVDPYGPNPPAPDLWREYTGGASSYWLWADTPPCQGSGSPASGGLTPAAGGGLTTLDGDVTIDIPAGAVITDTTLYYTVVPKPFSAHLETIAGATVLSNGTTTVPANHTFSITAADAVGNPVATLLVSATMTITFTDSDLTYVISDTLGIYLWDEGNGGWASLPSKLDLAHKSVSTTITTLGIYSLRGQPSNPPPAILAVDPIEGDSTVGTQITISGTNFLDRPFVQVGEWHLPDVHFVSTSTLTATIPAGLDAGTYDVTVENPDGQATTLPSAFSSIGKVYLSLVLRGY